VLLAIVGIVATILLLAACTDATGDAPVTKVDDKGAAIIQMPDGFSNVAAKCDGPNMVYVIYHNDAYGSIAVVKDDPRCVTTAVQ
jgi:hypothetical protein